MDDRNEIILSGSMPSVVSGSMPSVPAQKSLVPRP
jgi:hypothetical protein